MKLYHFTFAGMLLSGLSGALLLAFNQFFMAAACAALFVFWTVQLPNDFQLERTLAQAKKALRKAQESRARAKEMT